MKATKLVNVEKQDIKLYYVKIWFAGEDSFSQDTENP